WYFNTYDGKQSYNGKSYSYYAWAVHDGDVGASVVPVPAAVWLFGSGLIGLVGFARRKKI
ncbi:MAG: VPLPA-CTERM sorting domain-containing protein, partial [Gammaproteobacteria bacterium]|nr:VPLPA-CTERM sorting domain-containing protein [Gammaproteobacteria bacterium]